jgi:glutaredoxin 3
MERNRAPFERDAHPIPVKPVRVYTTQTCPYCVQAKRLLRKKSVPYQEIDVSRDDDARLRLMQSTGRRTVPQIFIGERHVGGSDDLHALEARGELDRLLQ